MLRLVEEACQILLGLADVLRNDFRKINPVDRKSGGLAEQARRHGLARSRWTIKQTAESRLEPFLQSPLVQERTFVANPNRDVLNLLTRLWIKHEIVPLVRRGDPLRRKFRAQRWVVRRSG